jgi:hypothetical protein
MKYKVADRSDRVLVVESYGEAKKDVQYKVLGYAYDATILRVKGKPYWVPSAYFRKKKGRGGGT